MLQGSPLCPPAFSGFELARSRACAGRLGLLTPLAPPIAAARSSVLNLSSRHIAETLLDIRG